VGRKGYYAAIKKCCDGAALGDFLLESHQQDEFLLA
jgi:hypothetical protein